MRAHFSATSNTFGRALLLSLRRTSAAKLAVAAIETWLAASVCRHTRGRVAQANNKPAAGAPACPTARRAARQTSHRPKLLRRRRPRNCAGTRALPPRAQSAPALAPAWQQQLLGGASKTSGDGTGLLCSPGQLEAQLVNFVLATSRASRRVHQPAKLASNVLAEPPASRGRTIRCATSRGETARGLASPLPCVPNARS